MLNSELAWLGQADNARLLQRGLRGVEKETLRVDPTGLLAGTPHPPPLGSPLTHPYLTTDYSEALLEFVTPPRPTNAETLAFLGDLHAFVYEHLGEELLWPPSMPCIVSSDEAVPIAQYGSSNEGRFRTVYRSGLGLRYGRAMQAIAGIHFNYSLPIDFWPAFGELCRSRQETVSFRSDRFMGLVRNYRRLAWLVAYLFGASPAFCKSFRPQGHPRLEALDAHTWHAPFATSLRMSDMGYRNRTQSRLRISANSLSDYVGGLRAAVSRPDPGYAAIGVTDGGEFRQLNANVLQIENEYYSSIRPKSQDMSLRPMAALERHGVEYVEIRTLDLNVTDPLGLDDAQMCFVEALLVHCLLADSPPIDHDEQDEIDARELRVAWEGRRPGVELPRDGRLVRLDRWGREVVDRLTAVAAILDDGDRRYESALQAARIALEEPDRTPSARQLATLKAEEASFFEYGLARAQAQRRHFAENRLDRRRRAELEQIAARSLAAQAALEAAPQPAFADYLRAYLGG